MAPSDSQQPEIGVREEEEEVGKTKQTTLNCLGWAWTDKPWRERWCKGATQEGELKKGNRE